MIKRQITEELTTLASEFPIIAVIGPRQSGKTTLVRTLFSDYKYVSLENPDIRLIAEKDPRSFLEQYHSRVIFDEIQKVPSLLSYLQEIVDTRNITGDFIITGSHNFLLMEQVNQSLAGRVGIATLLPLNIFELNNHGINYDLEEHIISGGYARIYDKTIRPHSFYRSYLATYIEKDIRSIKNINNLSAFNKFVHLLAGRSGQLLNLSNIANDCGVAVNTLKDWLSILEAGFIVFTLKPFHQNFHRRLIKSPKIYFYDTGLLCYLLGIQKTDQYRNHYYRGNIFENLIISELFKHNYNTGQHFSFYFWRDRSQNEIDLLIDSGNKLTAVEIKSAKTMSDEFLKGLFTWKKISATPDENLALIYAGEPLINKYHQIATYNWNTCYKILKS